MEFSEVNGLLHGGDYNADQWLDRPEILKEDIRLMKKAGVNVVTLGIFSWASLEPEEGVFTFEWLDQIMDSMYENGIYVILATPSAGKPPWMAKKYPEIMQTDRARVRHLYGRRKTQCNSSKVYQEKVRIIDEKLAERYAHHPALLMWHISNEISGECHCPDCQENFRKWLKDKYGTIDNLNKQYCSKFWSHTYNDWSEIESPAPHGESAVHGLMLDYKRFSSDMLIRFVKMELDIVKKYNPDIPATTNMYDVNCEVNYNRLADILDVTSWDSYPLWHCGTDKKSEWKKAVEAAFNFDFCRSLKNAPFVLMESTTSTNNHFEISKLKRPGMHMLSSMQAVACGSDSVMYFQWRQSLGSYEKFHSAVVSHNGSADTRVFRDVVEVGEKVQSLSFIKNTKTWSDVAIIYDWENMRALYEQKNLRNHDQEYDAIMYEHYEAILKNYVSVDIIDQSADFSKYKLIIAPMLYMFKTGTQEKIRNYVEQGGNFVMTYYSGIVNENDLCFECWSPYGLNDVFGVKSEEIDSLCDEEYNQFTYNGKIYKAKFYCDLLNVCGAEVLSEYECDFYAGRPALTKNSCKQGMAYYIACRSDKDFLYDFYHTLIDETGIRRMIDSPYVDSVMVKERADEESRYVFYMNFSVEPRTICGTQLAGYEVQLKKEKRILEK